jgi:hypothetical protein
LYSVASIADEVEQIAAELRRHLAELGMTPIAMARLGLDLAKSEAIAEDRLRAVEGAAVDEKSLYQPQTKRPALRGASRGTGRRDMCVFVCVR